MKKKSRYIIFFTAITFSFVFFVSFDLQKKQIKDFPEVTTLLESVKSHDGESKIPLDESNLDGNQNKATDGDAYRAEDGRLIIKGKLSPKLEAMNTDLDEMSEELETAIEQAPSINESEDKFSGALNIDDNASSVKEAEAVISKANLLIFETNKKYNIDTSQITAALSVAPKSMPDSDPELQAIDDAQKVIDQEIQEFEQLLQ